MSQIPIGDLPPETLRKLGIKLEPPLEQSSKRHTALGKVLKVITDLDEDDALWVLHEAKMIHRYQGDVILEEAPGADYIPTMAWTVEIVAKAFGVTLQDITGRRRNASIVLPRQVAMHLLWSFQKYTLAEIGFTLGERTPATVSHGFDTISRALQRDKSLKKRVDLIKETLL